MPYLLDTNVFIAAKKLHYGLDFCPAFWDWIVQEHAAGRLFSIEKVGDELIGQGDDLSTWASARGAAFFLPPTAATIPSLGAVNQWVTNQSYTRAAVNEFLQVADSYLVAQAHSSGFTVVTHEKAEASRNVVKIPNACLGVSVSFKNPFEMLRLERAHFVLGKRR